MAEFIIVIPTLLLLALGIMQVAFLMMAKSTLNQATISGARRGAVYNGSACEIRGGVVKGLTPLFQNAGDAADKSLGYLKYKAARDAAWDKTTNSTSGGLNNVRITILNPTAASFDDFADNGIIPNSRLLYRNTNVGTNSKQTIQDANLLKIRTRMCYPLFPSPYRYLLQALHPRSGDSGFDAACYGAGGSPLQSDATILMQSSAYRSKIDENAADCSAP